MESLRIFAGGAVAVRPISRIDAWQAQRLAEPPAALSASALARRRHASCGHCAASFATFAAAAGVVANRRRGSRLPRRQAAKTIGDLRPAVIEEASFSAGATDAKDAETTVLDLMDAAALATKEASVPLSRAPASMSGLDTAGGTDWRINLLYDGDCVTCMRQVEFLTKHMDENPEYAGLVRLTNLAAPDYSPEECGGVKFADGMRHIHAVTREGKVVSGMDVFRHVYRTVGMEWVYTVTTLPVLGAAFDWAYDIWAQHRLWLTGRADAVERVREHQEQIEALSAQECDVECEIDWDVFLEPEPAS